MDVEETEMVEKAATVKRDLYADISAGCRVQRGHWDVFELYCIREGLKHKEGMMRMIELCVPKECMDFIYQGDPPRRTDGRSKGSS